MMTKSVLNLDSVIFISFDTKQVVTKVTGNLGRHSLLFEDIFQFSHEFSASSVYDWSPLGWRRWWGEEYPHEPQLEQL